MHTDEALQIKKVVIVGPESTGKSTLCKQLSEYYNTSCCPEYAREYLLKHGTNYSFEDLLKVAQGQIELENKYIQLVKQKDKCDDCREKSKDLIILDTDMYVMKVWCEFVFGKCHQWILNQIIERKYDLYLLCKPDIPWVKDELREYPDYESREKLYHIYKDLLINQSVPWIEITGMEEQRLNAARKAIENIL